MFFNHPHTELKNQILAVASYAAAGDCLTELYNKAAKGQQSVIMAMVNQLKEKSRTLYASDFLRYANALARKLGVQTEMVERRNNYLRLCNDLMEPTPERCSELNTKYRECTELHNRILYLLRCFVDCGAAECMKKILASLPENIKNSIIRYVFPEAFVSMLDIPDDRMAAFMLDAGMNPDSYVSWSNFFGDSCDVTLLTFALNKLGRMIDKADDPVMEEAGYPRTHSIDLRELQIVRNMIEALLVRKADPDIDAHYVGDPGTPRGLAYTLLTTLNKRENIPLLHDFKMREVLKMVIDTPRKPDFKPRGFCFEPGW